MKHMYRACISGLLTGVIGLICVTQAVGQQACRPALAFKEVRFSEVHRPTMERKWTAVVSVDASRCATTAGSFEIIFSLQKENGPEIEFREQAPAVTVAVDFWADEAVEGYWIHNVAPCPCRR